MLLAQEKEIGIEEKEEKMEVGVGVEFQKYQQH
jgi:hypothetical protein